MKNSSLAWAILIVGLVNAAVLGWGFKQFNEYFRYKSFDSNISAGNRFEVVTLPQSRFAVVKDSEISVYQVDKLGQVKRLSDVSTYDKELEQNQRRANPAPTR